MVDFALLAEMWNFSQGQAGYNERYDLSGDGVIEFDDLAMFCEDWLSGVE